MRIVYGNMALSLVIALLAGCASATAPAPSAAERYAHLPLAGSEGIVAPKVVQRVDPRPPADFLIGQASAKIQAVVDEHGRVIDAWYIGGSRQYAQELLKVIRAWTFHPATKDGKAVPVRFEVTSTFRRL